MYKHTHAANWIWVMPGRKLPYAAGYRNQETSEGWPCGSSWQVMVLPSLSLHGDKQRLVWESQETRAWICCKDNRNSPWAQQQEPQNANRRDRDRCYLLEILNRSELPPFTIEEETDGGDELRMKYRYLDLRRAPVKNNIILRHRVAQEVRKYMDSIGFCWGGNPVWSNPHPKVPATLSYFENAARYFYALPQSPQTLKQLLMVAGFDRYFQIVKCFRMKIWGPTVSRSLHRSDCEMSFVEREDVLNTFEGLAKQLFRAVKNIEFSEPFTGCHIPDAIKYYGSR